MTDFIVLNIGVDYMEQEVGYVNLCTKEVFEASIAPFSDNVRWKAANLAAHGWDVVLFTAESSFGHCLFIGSGYDKSGTFYYTNGMAEPTREHHLNIFYPEKRLDFSNLNPNARKFFFCFYALRRFAAAIRYDNYASDNGQPIDLERQRKRKKAKLQNFWDELSTYEDII